MYCVCYLASFNRCWGEDNGFSCSYHHIQSPLLLFYYQLLESHNPTNKPSRHKALSKNCSNGKKVSTQSARVGNEHQRKELKREEVLSWEVCCNNIEFQACRWRKRFFCKDSGGWCHQTWQRQPPKYDRNQKGNPCCVIINVYSKYVKSLQFVRCISHEDSNVEKDCVGYMFLVLRPRRYYAGFLFS